MNNGKYLSSRCIHRQGIESGLHSNPNFNLVLQLFDERLPPVHFSVRLASGNLTEQLSLQLNNLQVAGRLDSVMLRRAASELARRSAGLTVRQRPLSTQVSYFPRLSLLWASLFPAPIPDSPQPASDVRASRLGRVDLPITSKILT